MMETVLQFGHDNASIGDLQAGKPLNAGDQTGSPKYFKNTVDIRKVAGAAQSQPEGAEFLLAR